MGRNHRFDHKGLTRTQRGLGTAHDKERARLLPLAYGRPCPYYGIDPKCPGLMLEGQKLHLDHGRPRALGGRTGDGTGQIAHAGCNQRAGARLGRAIQLMQRGRGPSTSRQW